MTEDEREELIQKMAKAVVLAENASPLRAALAVAEPVIREQADNTLREENARLREVVKAAYYEGWLDSANIDDTFDYEGRLNFDWLESEACAAIQEGGKAN